MSNESIFSKVVRSEDSYTQLLCNLMQRDESFRSQVLLLLFREYSIGPVRPDQIYTQSCIGADGRPDIVIKTDSTLALVEVKTSRKRGLTLCQERPANDVDKGYENFLRNCEKRKPWLILLVPSDWEHREAQEKRRTTLRSKGISFNLILWEEILNKLVPCDPSAQAAQAIVEEFRLLLSELYGPISFLSEEVIAMFSQSFTLHAVLKLNAVLEGIRTRAGRKLASPMDIKKDEFGFYLKKGKRWLFYVGCWQTFWDDGNHYPICFGIEDDSPIIVTAFRNAFRKAYKQEAVTCGKWTLGWVTEDDFEGPDTVGLIWSKLKPIWEAVAKAAK